jgi:hypothetical protein
MKRDRPADDLRRRAIKARLQGIPSREIARRLERSHDTVKGYLGSCGATIKGIYYLNGLAAEALFTQGELLELGAVWDGRCWVGPGCPSSPA